MSDQIMTFTPGTLVWVKVYNRIWWPGRVVDPTTAPNAMQEYMLRKKNPKVLVYFERDDKYDVVINMDKIELYSTEKKTEFLKKGYSLYLKEKKGKKTQNVEMETFIKDVKKYEQEINGNIDIFKQFEEEIEEHPPPPKELIKELFIFGKSSSAKEIQTHKKPFVFGKSPSAKEQLTPQKPFVFGKSPSAKEQSTSQKPFVFGKSPSAKEQKTPKKPFIFGKSPSAKEPFVFGKSPSAKEPFVFGESSSSKEHPTPKEVFIFGKSCIRTPPIPVRNQKSSNNSHQTDFACHLRNTCNFTTTRYSALKRHMLFCKAPKIINPINDKLSIRSKDQSPSCSANVEDNKTKRNSTELNTEVLPEVNSYNRIDPKFIFTASSLQKIINPIIEKLSIQDKEQNPSCSTYVEVNKKKRNHSELDTEVSPEVNSNDPKYIFTTSSLQKIIDPIIEKLSVQDKEQDLSSSNNLEDNKTKRNSTELNSEVLRGVYTNNTNNSIYPKNHLTKSPLQILISPIIEKMCIQNRRPNPSCSTDIKHLNDEEEKKVKDEFINRIIMIGEDFTGLFPYDEVDSKEEEITTQQQISQLTQFPEFKWLFDVNLKPIGCEIENSFIPHICTELIIEPNLIKLRKHIQLFRSYLVPADEEDSKHRNRYPKLIGKFWKNLKELDSSDTDDYDDSDDSDAFD